MVGRLVEHQDVGLVEQELGEADAGRSPPLSRPICLVDVVAAEEHERQHVAELLAP